MDEVKHKEYSNGEITVIWKPEICIHSGICVRNSPQVFRPKQRPWVQIEAASTEEIKQTVEKCPSGALAYRLENQPLNLAESASPKTKTQIEILSDGPLIVSGEIEIKNSDGSITNLPSTTNALCRCGASKNKPFCDGSHSEVNFRG